MFVFATAELYITNKIEFWFGYSNVFIPVVILCICLLIAAFLFSIIVPDTIVRFCIYLIACLNLAIYIQGNYLASGYGELNGSFHQTGRVYHGGTLDRSYRYELGTKLYFNNQATANIHEISGFSRNEGTHTWTNGKTSEMMFELDTPVDSNLVLNMEYWTMGGEERVIVNVNGKQVYDYVADGNESVNIFIPREYVLGQDIALKFEFPDAHANENDSRFMALAMKSITISKY